MRKLLRGAFVLSALTLAFGSAERFTGTSVAYAQSAECSPSNNGNYCGEQTYCRVWGMITCLQWGSRSAYLRSSGGGNCPDVGETPCHYEIE
jgi:hypothetical protein